MLERLFNGFRELYHFEKMGIPELVVEIDNKSCIIRFYGRGKMK